MPTLSELLDRYHETGTLTNLRQPPPAQPAPSADRYPDRTTSSAPPVQFGPRGGEVRPRREARRDKMQQRRESFPSIPLGMVSGANEGNALPAFVANQASEIHTGAPATEQNIMSILEQYNASKGAEEYYNSLTDSPMLERYLGRKKQAKYEDYSPENLESLTEYLSKPSKQKKIARWEKKGKETGIDTDLLSKYAQEQPQLMRLPDILRNVAQSPESVMRQSTAPMLGRAGLLGSVRNMLRRRNLDMAVMRPAWGRESVERFESGESRFGDQPGARMTTPRLGRTAG